MTSVLALCLALAGLVPASADPIASLQLVEQQSSFGAVLANHLRRALGGLDALPSGKGNTMVPGVFVTLGLDRMDVFEDTYAALQNGRPDPTPAPDCASGCPAAFYDAMRSVWLQAAVETTKLGVELPGAVYIAAHRALPVETLLDAAYAAAESRPASPPRLGLVVDSPAGGLRAQPFFLLPPRGLELQAGSAALGLTIEASPGRLRVTGSESTLGAGKAATELAQLRGILATVKKRNPGKDAAIVIPGEGMTVGQLVDLLTLVRSEFEHVVLSRGQPLVY